MLLYVHWNDDFFPEEVLKPFTQILKGPVVQKVNRAIHRINHYPVDNAIGFPDIYPLESDLSGG